MAWRYPRHIAHRCGGALAPENTLAGLRLAARLGFRAVEFDVMLSADGVPVLIHDETLDRTTDGSGKVDATSLARLARLDAGIKHHRAFSGESLPTLEQALLLCRVLKLSANLEVKPALAHERDTGKAVARLAQIALRQWPEASLLLSSFSEDALVAVHDTAAGLPCALLVEHIPPDWPARLRQLHCSSLHCAARHLRPEQATELTSAGVPLACYTVNRPEEAVPLFAAGVAAIFTDRIDLFDPHTYD